MNAKSPAVKATPLAMVQYQKAALDLLEAQYERQRQILIRGKLPPENALVKRSTFLGLLIQNLGVLEHRAKDIEASLVADGLAQFDGHDNYIKAVPVPTKVGQS